MSLKNLARPGDILFYKVTPKSSVLAWLIGFVQAMLGDGRDKSYSHVSIVSLSRYLQVEAWWPRVRLSQIDWDHPGIELWRIRGITGSERLEVVVKARSMVGMWYDMGQFLLGVFDFNRAEICTTLVVKSAAVAGFKLAAGAGRMVSPNELAMDYALYRVEGV